MLVVLRMAIGWHFLYAGLWKLENPSFSSAGFLEQAKGPLAEKFLGMLPDRDGRLRLDPSEPEDEEYPNATLAALADAHRRFAEYYELTKTQADKAAEVLKTRKEQVLRFLEDNKEPIQEYFQAWDKLEQQRQQKTKDIPYEQKRYLKQRSDLQSQAKGWLDELERIQKLMARDLDLLLTDQQRSHGAPSHLDSLQKIDLAVTYSNLAIGFCLLAGLFTRLASLGGGLFLLSIVLAQPDWPGLYPPPPPAAGRTLLIGKEAIEMLALFALATTRVGRWGGLDFFVHHWLIRPLFGRKEAK